MRSFEVTVFAWSQFYVVLCKDDRYSRMDEVESFLTPISPAILYNAIFFALRFPATKPYCEHQMQWCCPALPRGCSLGA